MRHVYRNYLAAMAVGLACGTSAGLAFGEGAGNPVGVVSHVKVLSDKVPDVSSLEAWKKSYIKDGMNDKEKALAIFDTEVAFQTADAPPMEFLQRENCVLDPVKMFNVYGETFCSVSAANIACMARYVGLKARNSTVQNHTIPEIYYDNAWHMLDSDLIEYYPKADGSIASIPEMIDGIQSWLKDHPGFSVALSDKQARYKWMRDHNWKKEGPEILSRSPFYDANGWLPCADFAWGDTMQQFSKFGVDWESCYSMGYEVNIQLRRGERLTRNWSNKGLFANMDTAKKPPASIKAKPGEGSMKYSPKWGDIAPGRIGNGTVEYVVPLTDPTLPQTATMFDNLAVSGNGLAAKDPAKPAVLEIRNPSSYVYLQARATLNATVGDGGKIAVLFSDNNGLDWKDLATLDKSGETAIDLNKLVIRKYDYRLRLVLAGKGTSISSLKFGHDIQHSQRPMPALKQGENTITFSSPAQEGTITIEGAMDLPANDAGKALRYADFHPKADGVDTSKPPKTKNGSITFPIKTPGDITRIRASSYFIASDSESMYVIEASFDDGKTWKTIDQPTTVNLTAEKPRKFVGRYGKCADVPAGARTALVRYRATGSQEVSLFNARIDADYKEPAGGFAPVQVTYVWEEGGIEKKDVHIAKTADETYTIKCETSPVMKSLVLELAK